MKSTGLRLSWPLFLAVFFVGACDSSKKTNDNNVVQEKNTAAAAVAPEQPSAQQSDLKKPIEVFVETVNKTEIFEPIVFAGYVESENRYAVTAESAGVLETLKVRAGDRVRKGQQLVVVKPVSQGLTFKSLVITSPLTGIVSEISAVAGFPVTQGQPILMVERDDALIIQVNVPAQDLSHAKIGSLIDVAVGEKKTKGTIQSVNSRADKITGTFPARVRLNCDKQCADFPLGSLARTTIRSQERRGFKIPISWLQQQRKKVVTIDSENKARWVPVKLGSYLGEYVEITEGLSDGLRIVSGFSERPEEGDLLTVKSREDATISAKSTDKPKG